MNQQQDLTPMERVDGELLERLLQRTPHCDGSDGETRSSPIKSDECPRGHGVKQERMGDMPCLHMTDLSCGGEGENGIRVAGFGVENGIPAALYVAYQPFNHLYEEEEALRRGTLFRALDKPFYGGRKEKCCHGER